MDDALLEAGYEVAVSMVRYQDVVNAKKRASRTLQPDELQQLPEFLRRRMVATAGRHSASDQIVAARFGVGPLVSRPDEMDPLFSLNSAALDEIRRMPEPFRSKLLDRLVWSLPPEAVLDVARYDEEIAEHIRRERVRRMAGLDGEEHGDKQGAPGLPYASRVQYDSRYFTHETEPSRHHPVADRGLYCLLARDAGEMEALVPEGVPRSLKVEFDATARRAVMLRAESLGLWARRWTSSPARPRGSRRSKGTSGLPRWLPGPSSSGRRSAAGRAAARTRGAERCLRDLPRTGGGTW